ncbi:MAG: hypothetical protein WCL44_13705, partial [bacterium]
PKRLRRADSFLGIHFDFHAGKDCTEVGKTVTRRMIEKIIEQVKPDYIQCDCKGHPGISSYPTKVGNPAPGFVQDQLRIWRDVTAERGVALYMHYSGVWDSEAIAKHPEWARVDEKGKRDPNNTSVFGPYVDKLMIPQLKELSDVYGVDGVWCDGECWATLPDYGRNVLEAFRRETGIRNIPRKPGDAHFLEFKEFCREGFRRYLKYYVDEIHRHNPDFQAASNWAYTSFMPEPVLSNVDFISGDYPMQNAISMARLEGRCCVHQGKPWDLMAWSFSGKWEDRPWSTKSIPQLQQEAAAVLSIGGGFQGYFQQRRDGSIREWAMKLMAEVAKFCRARQKVCHKATPVPQVGLVFSAAAYYRTHKRLFAHLNNEVDVLSGILNMLLESQFSTDIVMEHQLAGRMQEYPLLVVPQWEYLEEKFKADLRRYVRNGGSLLLIGPGAAALFQKELGVKFAGKAESKIRYIEHDGWLGGLNATAQTVEPGRGAKVFGRMYPGDEAVGKGEPAATIARLGKGRIAAVYVDLGDRYRAGATSTARKFLAALARELFTPIVDVEGSRYVDVALNRTAGEGKLAINLVNTAGPHHDPNVYVYDEIPPVGPLAVTIRTGRRPGKITLHPAGRKLDFTFSHGEVKLELPRLVIHDIIVVD